LIHNETQAFTPLASLHSSSMICMILKPLRPSKMSIKEKQLSRLGIRLMAFT